MIRKLERTKDTPFPTSGGSGIENSFYALSTEGVGGVGGGGGGGLGGGGGGGGGGLVGVVGGGGCGGWGWWGCRRKTLIYFTRKRILLLNPGNSSTGPEER